MDIKHCADCRDGEHDNYDDDVRLVMVRDPDENNKLIKRSNMCDAHQNQYLDDGYTVKILK